MLYPFRDPGESWAAYIRRLEARYALRNLAILFVGVFAGLAFACTMFSYDRFELLARVHRAEIKARMALVLVKEVKAMQPVYFDVPPIQLFLGEPVTSTPPLLLHFGDDLPICRRHPRWNITFSFH